MYGPSTIARKHSPTSVRCASDSRLNAASAPHVVRHHAHGRGLAEPWVGEAHCPIYRNQQPSDGLGARAPLRGVIACSPSIGGLVTEVVDRNFPSPAAFMACKDLCPPGWGLVVVCETRLGFVECLGWVGVGLAGECACGIASDGKCEWGSG